MALTEDQQFCLRWNNFQAYITSQFEVLRDDEDFVDVTLACEGQRLGAHKVVLSACSPFFKELFKTNPCPHPIIFMRDVELPHVIALLEFMYAGEVNVAQAHLTGFLKTAESLQIRGLTDASKIGKENEQLGAEAQSSVESTPVRHTSARYRQAYTRLRNSPSGTVTSTQDKHADTGRGCSPSPVKKLRKTDPESDRLDGTEPDEAGPLPDDLRLNNPFAVQPGGRPPPTDTPADLLQPKLELPDYSEEDTCQDNSQPYHEAAPAAADDDGGSGGGAAGTSGPMGPRTTHSQRGTVGGCTRWTRGRATCAAACTVTCRTCGSTSGSYTTRRTCSAPCAPSPSRPSCT